MPDKFGGETGQDPTVTLPPVEPRKPRPNAKAEGAPAAGDIGQTIADAIMRGIQQGGAQPVVKIRYGEENKSEVIVRANRRVHISPADLALSQINGTAYGIDGASKAYDEGAVIVMRDGPGLQSMLSQGFVRTDPPHPRA